MEPAVRILFFDSGVGGLSVLQDVYKLIPRASYYYLFDHECFPYGNKSEVFLQKRVCTLLLALSEKIHPDLIVIACNTASTIVLPTLREHFKVPIVGVVPAIKPAAKLSVKQHIALLATEGTVKRAYTDFLINEFASLCKVMKIGSQELVRLCESHLMQDHDLSSEEHQRLQEQTLISLRNILSPILALPPKSQPDVVVLGCTHFPLLKAEIAAILGPHIQLVDSGEAVARRVQYLLERQGLSVQEDTRACGSAKVGEAKLSYGFQEAFFTGATKCDALEKEQLEEVFRHFGFATLSPLWSLFTPLGHEFCEKRKWVC